MISLALPTQWGVPSFAHFAKGGNRKCLRKCADHAAGARNETSSPHSLAPVRLRPTDKNGTAPAPFLRRAHQAPLHRIAMSYISASPRASNQCVCSVASIPTRTARESCIRSSRLFTLVFQTQYRHGGSGLRAVCEGRELGRTCRATTPHPECSSFFPQLSSKKDQNLVTNNLY